MPLPLPFPSKTHQTTDDDGEPLDEEQLAVSATREMIKLKEYTGRGTHSAPRMLRSGSAMQDTSGAASYAPNRRRNSLISLV